jgi:hypothetical protein
LGNDAPVHPNDEPVHAEVRDQDAPVHVFKEPVHKIAIFYVY